MMRTVTVGVLVAMGVGCVPSLTTPVDTGDSGTTAWVAPDNRWPSEGPPGDSSNQGFSVGQLPPDLRMGDQFGDVVSLWQLVGHPVVLDISAVWCAPCQALAVDTQATADAYADVGLVYVTLLAQDLEGGAPDQAVLALWADSFGITNQPVIGDDEGGSYTSALIASRSGQLPILLVLGADLRVYQEVGTPSDVALRAAIDASLGR